MEVSTSTSSSSSSSNVEAIKPVFLKAGIPLAISLLGFISAKIISKRITAKSQSAASAETEVRSFGIQTNPLDDFRHEEESFKSLSSEYREDEEEMAACANFANRPGSGVSEDENVSEEGILGLKRRIEELQDREWELEMKFIQYCELKEQESVLVEHKNMLLLESAYMNFLDREISLMNAEYKKLESLGEKCLKVVQKLETLRSQNRLLRRKAKKLVRLTKGLSSSIKEKDLRIKAEEEEILRNRNLLETQTHAIRNLEDEICTMRYLVHELQEQKDELLNKLNSAENPNSASAHSKEKETKTVMEEYEQLAHEFEELQKERAAEMKEIIFLRWSNACLRHELMRHQTQQEYKHENKHQTEKEELGASGELSEYGLEHQLDDLVLANGEPTSTGVVIGGEVCSKRRKLLQKFRRWVEGSESTKAKLDAKQKHENKCFGRHSVPVEAEEQLIHGRKSCSSA